MLRLSLSLSLSCSVSVLSESKREREREREREVFLPIGPRVYDSGGYIFRAAVGVVSVQRNDDGAGVGGRGREFLSTVQQRFFAVEFFFSVKRIVFNLME